jgi:type IV pilus assembly protein PilY1
LLLPPLALADAAQRAVSSSCVAAALDTDGASPYRTAFLSDGLSGSLQRLAVQIDGDGRAGAAPQPLWDAGALLDAAPPAQRSIFTARDDRRAGLQLAPLSWEALGRAQRAALDAAPDGSNDGLGRQRLDYLRGVRTAEQGRPGGIFRSRAGILGATVAGVPLPFGRAVYFAANDGMLHAFDAASGAELFAYLPRAVLPRASLLTAPQYRNAPFVEGAVVAGAAMTGGKRVTVLAGGMGSAAKGVAALAFDDPARLADGNALPFEFNENDDPDMGNVFNAPQIAHARIGSAAAADYLVVGGGYNAGGHGQVALFLLSLDKKPADAWKLGRNYFKWLAPADDALPNGLAGAALAADDAGNARAAYAGDLRGRLWRFDFAETRPLDAAAREPVFIASDRDGGRQPITAAPRLAYAPDGLLVLFGTGSVLAAGDGGDRSPQTLYGVRDHGGATVSATRAGLAERLLTIAGNYRVSSASADDGWYLDFPEAGERSVWGVAQYGTSLVAASVIPRGVPCAADARLYWLDAMSGKPAPGIAAPLPMPAAAIGRAPMVLQQVDAGPADGRGARPIASRRLLVGAAAPSTLPARVESRATGRAGRLGWREILDAQGLRDAAPGD